MNYDGFKIHRHLVKKGETLESIGKRYGFSDWRILQKYNCRYIKTLGSQSDKIVAGKVLFIPRSKGGYETSIRKINYLKSFIAAAADQAEASMDADFYQLKASNLVVDTVADSLTFLATSMTKAGKAISSFAKAYSSYGSKAGAYQQLGKIAMGQLDDQIREKGFTTALSAMGYYVLGEKGKENVDSSIKYSTTLLKMRDAIVSHTFQGGKNLLNAADIVLDYASPSKVAYTYVTLSEGGSLTQAIFDNEDDLHKSYKANINKTVAQSQLNLDKKIKSLMREKDDLYG